MAERCGRFRIVFEGSVVEAQRNRGLFFVKKEQESTMRHLFNDKDVMAVLPAECGKNLIFR